MSLLVSAVALTGCPADPAVWGDAQWQVRCPDGFSGCSRAGDRVDIFNFDGVDGITADCSVRRSGDERVVDLTVGKGSQRLAITSLLTGATGGAVRAGCFATIIDDANTYGGRTFGTCGGGVPGEGQPCQISNLIIDPDDPEGPTVAMDILCRNLPAAAEPTRLQRDVVSPDDQTRPARVRMLNCPGVGE